MPIDLASATGAGIIGLGVGALAAPVLIHYAPLIVVLGMILHGWGMFAKHRLDARAELPLWAVLLYWSCWIGLAALAFWLVAPWARP